MKRLLICMAALLGACAQDAAQTDAGPPALQPPALPLADGAGNRMEALTQRGDQGWCTEDRVWCVRLLDDSIIEASREGQSAATLPIAAQEVSEWSLWPSVIRHADGEATIGVLRRTNQMYSGGGAQVQDLSLYTISNGTAQDAGVLPYSGGLIIRACFDEEDQRARRDACHDEYDFFARVSLNEGVSAGPAQILVETAATTYPGRRSRNEGSTEAPPLEALDLVRWQDEACSYRRTYIRGADGRYAPDEALPDCSQYLEP